MKVSIIYNSKHGTTKAYAEEIEKFLTGKGVTSELSSIDDYNPESLRNADMVFLGAWTHGLMIFAQHPEKAWKDFVSDMPAITGKKLALFTTYKLATGSLFRKMTACLGEKAELAGLILKSKNGKLSEEDKRQLEEFVG